MENTGVNIVSSRFAVKDSRQEYVQQGDKEFLKSSFTHVEVRCKRADFFQFYIHDTSVFAGLSSTAYAFIITAMKLAQESKKEVGNVVTIDKEFKEEVMRLCPTIKNERSLNPVLRSLVQRGLLFHRGYRGKYYLNPAFFYKGVVSEGTEKVERLVSYVFED